MKDFIPFKEAVAIKELDFNEPCFATYIGETFDSSVQFQSDDYFTAAPLFSQAFRFFREKYGLYHVSHIVRPYNDPEEEYPEEVWIGKVCQSDREQFVNTDNGLAHNHFYTHEEAELACLKKLIELVKQK